MLAALFILRKKLGGIDGKRVILAALKSLAASVVMGFAVFYTAQFVGEYVDLARGMGRLIQVFSAITVGVVLYLVSTLALRMDEPRFLWQALGSRLLRSRGKGA